MTEDDARPGPLTAGDPGFVSMQVIQALLAGVDLAEMQTPAIIDLTRARVEVDGDITPLGLAELRLIAALARAGGSPVGRALLAREIVERGRASERTVDAVVGRLRIKLGPYATALHAHYGSGYSLRPPPDLVVRDFGSAHDVVLGGIEAVHGTAEGRGPVRPDRGVAPP
ncbi:winged helix-turn-helix domain-containing protein [Subtercola sp. YIM 133946]|uniref:winged helix-turn-helix domain-containing protein n=1 Tax=Subtercola sp. YIM 133946 TaxID=3118909 RepID=UPI002F94F6D5